MGKGVKLFVFVLFLIFILNFISAETIGNNIPVQIQTTNSTGGIVIGTFTLAVNISTSSDCSSVVFNHTTTNTTDSRGIISYDIPNINLNFTEQYYFCYYRDGVLKRSLKLGRTPYAFNSKFLQGSLRNAFAPFNKSWTGDFTIAGSLFINGVDALNGSSDDSIPLGTIISYNGTICPNGFNELTSARGRYIVGLQSDGTLEGTVGTAFTSDLESRTVGQHNHGGTSFGSSSHKHEVPFAVSGPTSIRMKAGGDAFGTGSTGFTSANTLATSAGVTGDTYSLTNTPTATSSIANSGSVAGTNAPYIQYLTCIKTETVDLTQGWNQDVNNIWTADTTLNVGIGTSSPNYLLEVAKGTENAVNLSGILYINDTFGFVGIGTSSPSSKLTISGGNLEIRDGGDLMIRKSDNGWDWRIRQTLNQLDFHSGDDLTTPKVSFLSNGNVGIGVTAPLSTLSVGGVGSNQYAIFGTGSGKHGVLGQTDSTSSSFSGVFGHASQTTGTAKGVSGIGGSPSGYDFFAAGAGTDYGTASSIRWKENITKIQNALDKILQLQGNYFDWNIYNKTNAMGFIAEEVGKIVPQVVGYDDPLNESNWYVDENGARQLYATGLDYGALTPLLVEAIKELKQEKDSEINFLKQENNLLKSQLCQKDNSYSFC